MKKQQWLLGLGLLAFICLMVGATLLYDSLALGNEPDNLIAANPSTTTSAVESASPAPSATEQALAQAPDFTVIDRDGNEIKLSDLHGKPVILNFWASWCGPCKSEMPAFEAAYQTYGEQIHFLPVNVTDGSRETVETAKAYIDGQPYTFPIYFDTALEASIAYGASSIPLTVFINAEGELVAYASGALDAATLQRGIDMILPTT